jgi:hypothetical protein
VLIFLPPAQTNQQPLMDNFQASIAKLSLKPRRSLQTALVPTSLRIFRLLHVNQRRINQVAASMQNARLKPGC